MIDADDRRAQRLAPRHRRPAGAAAHDTGRLGVRFDRAAYERDGTLRVREVLPLGPAALAGIATATTSLAVDGAPIGRADEPRRAARTPRSTAASRCRSRRRGGAGAREVALRPVDAATEKGLLYRAVGRERRAYVAKASGGRLGYVHMPDMGDGVAARSSTSTSTPRTTGARAWWSTCATTTAAS